LNFGALGEGLLHVEKLSQGTRRVAGIRFRVGPILNLIVKEIIEISRIQRPTARQKSLL